MLAYEERTAVELCVRVFAAELKGAGVSIEKLRFATFCSRHELTPGDLAIVYASARATFAELIRTYQ